MVNNMSLCVSFEFFPPKTLAGEAALRDVATRLRAARPDFVSVTYGAGGSTRDASGRIVRDMQHGLGFASAMHLTCVGHTRADIEALARELWHDGIRHLVALRGDPPGGSGPYVPHPDGYAFAVDLIAGLMRVADFDISVAAYPETHPQATSPEADLDNLKRKLDAGGRRAITQFFFDNTAFYRFRDRAHKAGITAPIIPGVLPIHNFEQACRFAKLGGTHVPDRLMRLFDGLIDKEIQAHLATHLLAEQCSDLVANGVGHLHFYTLNRADATLSVCHLLGLTPALTPETSLQTA